MIHVGRLLVFTALFAGGLAAFGCQSIVGIEERTLDPCDEACERSYADKRGKYLKQTGVTLPKI